MTRGSKVARWSVLVLLLALIALPAHGVDKQGSAANRKLGHFSQSVATRYWIANPDQVPEALRGRFQAAHDAAARGAQGALAAPASVVGDRFNRDVTGLPQNEESVAVCRDDPRSSSAAPTTTAACSTPRGTPPAGTCRLTAAAASPTKGCCHRCSSAAPTSPPAVTRSMSPAPAASCTPGA